MVRVANQSLEVALLTGGAMTAAGLYVSTLAIKGTYAASRRLLGWLVQEEDATLSGAPRSVMYALRPQVALVARAPRGCGGLLLTPTAIFYLEAPSLRLYRLIPNETKALSLEPHAFYLLQAALTWEAQPRDETWARLGDFVYECALHMLLNDLARHATAAHAQLVADVFAKLSPAQSGWFFTSGDAPPTARRVLKSITLEQWQALRTALPNPTASSFRAASIASLYTCLGAELPPIELVSTKVQLLLGLSLPAANKTNDTPSSSRVVDGVGACAYQGRWGYTLAISGQ